MRRLVTQLGKKSINAVEELGYIFMLLVESMGWIFIGGYRKQPVRLRPIFQEAMGICAQSVPIACILCFSVGIQYYG